MKLALPLRVVMDDPVPGVTITLQHGSTGKAARVPAARAAPDALTFEFAVTVDGRLADGRPRFLGPYVQGPPLARFVYLCVGQAAGQPDSLFSMRVKIPLAGITAEQIETLPPGARLTAHIAGRHKSGVPAHATVPILAPGWQACTD
jgi:hypothetical protein